MVVGLAVLFRLATAHADPPPTPAPEPGVTSPSSPATAAATPAEPPAPSPEPVYETVTRARRRSREPTTRALSRREAGSVPGSVGDPLRALQSFPGVARPGLTAGDLLVRGAAPWDTGVTVDGHFIPQLYHFLQGPAVLNPAFLERVELHPGGWGVRNGRRQGALVEVTTRAPDRTRPRLELEADVVDGGIFASTPVQNGGAFAAALRRSILGDFIDDLTGQSAVPIYYDLQARYDVPAGALGDFTLFFFGSDDQLVFPVPEGVNTLTGPGGERLENETLLSRTIATLRKRWGDASLTVSSAFGFDHIEVATGADQLDYRYLTLRLRAEATLPVAAIPGITVRTGIDLERQFYDFRYELPGLDPFIGEFPTPRSDPYTIQNVGRDAIDLAGGWVELEAERGIVATTLGVRVDRFAFPAGNTRDSVDPRAAIVVQPVEALSFKLAAGLYHQAPLPRDLSGDFGNPELDLEHTTQLVAGVAVDLFGLRLEVEGYSNRLANGITGAGGVVERDGEIVWENLQNGQVGTGRGIEILLRRSASHRISGWLSYTLSRTERTNPGGEPELWSFDQTHILHAVLAFDLGGRWSLSGQWSYVTGNPLAPVETAIFDTDTDRYRPRYGEWGSERMPAFHQLDVRLEKRFPLWGGLARVYLEVLNAYNRQNPELLLYGPDYRERGYFTGLPILGTLGIGGSW